MRILAWLVPGLLLPLLLLVLPGILISILLVSILLFMAWLAKSRELFCLLAGMCWSLLQLHNGINQRLNPGLDEQALVKGVISSLPVTRGNMLEFRFRIIESASTSVPPKSLLLVRWYRDYASISAGETWQLALKIKPARSRVNFSGPDRERWYFAEGISGLGIVNSRNSHRLEPAGWWDPLSWRQQTRNSLNDILAEHPSRALILALALADRSEISTKDWKKFRLSGTSHLLAISGLHVGLAAMMGFWLGRLLLVFIPINLVLMFGPAFSWLCSASLAVYYAMMAGLGTSTIRALIMILTFYFVCLIRRNVPAWQGLLLAMFMVLLLNPLAPLSAGFWFSFLAVGILVFIFSNRHGQWHWFLKLLVAQASLTLVMFPVGMYWFQQLTLLGMVSNFIAIPWVSFTVVPAILLSIMTLPFDTWLAPFLLFTAAGSIQWLDFVLGWVVQTGQFASFTTRSPSLLITILATTGGLLLLMPRSTGHGLPGILLLAALVLPSRQAREKLIIEVLDVGQGLAVLIETQKHLLLYDTGPGDAKNWSLVSSSIQPAIANRPRLTPELIIVSHGDLDHAGGLFQIRTEFPDARVLGNLRHPQHGMSGCRAPLNWNWDGVEFKVLHPSPGLPYLGNDSSCVLSVRYGQQSILLTGDISTAVESRLVKAGLETHNILFAAHHGSKNSSSKAFIDAVSPQLTLVSSGYQNQFGFPHSSVKNRFRKKAIPLLNTADCGAIRLSLQVGKKLSISSARRQRKALWRWPPEAHCP